METLDNTDWDVVIVGTGLQQSLLALALSRSEKKILHLDENYYYGGAEAALSLQEAREWAIQVNGASGGAFSNVNITKPEPAGSEPSPPSLSFSRAYSLALSPQLVYARSSLLQYLVSSRVYRQLEFLAVGSWWVFSADAASESLPPSDGIQRHGRLLKVPNGREDVFQDHDLDFKAKRALMKFLRFIGEYEEQPEVWEEHRQQPFPTFLSEQFKVPAALQAPLLALTLSPSPSTQTTTEYALPRIARHLRSIGIFGAGFGSVIPKWGGLSEISQVSCRACAVGGGVYVLGKGLAPTDDVTPETSESGIKLHLKDGEAITAKWIVGGSSSTAIEDIQCRSMTIVSSALIPLFPPIAEDAPAPAAAVVVFPSGSLPLDSQAEELPAVHVLVHSSDTGECPAGQSILYASTSLHGQDGFKLLERGVQALLSSVEVTPSPIVLWSARYKQQPSSESGLLPNSDDHVVRFPPPSMDLAFDDIVLDQVKEVWQKITGEDAGEYLKFQDREDYANDDD
ncbi:rab geranylgeranyl transferase escort protein-like protein [Dothidotthia symphoricarpi CBS 119687]|uniref:Rab proteins geranylgeranyltransferase n=1 Tax=Dothidotthia symphoricarpi CBS 119687 TaxID=1392245 RepID=A0A6A6AG41_9PLEO|nr:rab geranylgeranyl transferase escort protein-like protein [Dothidotthia symphoricarpi CBS 119687]KAF2130879.1 rab geranylgeranyl transferase escort protein-like protein [Dothidotthia symphoricarpi CBS 119687]